MASSSPQSSELERGRDWSVGLPADVAGEIMSRFSSSGDRVRFSAISPWWRRSAAAVKRPSHPPWLMLPGAEGEEDEEHRSLYSCSERKLYHVHLPQIRGQHCVGSGEGWIITVNKLTGNLQLLDFLTGSTTFLPSITTFSDVADTPLFDRGRLKGYMSRSPISEVHFRPEVEEGVLLILQEAREFKLWKLEHIYSFYKKAVFFPSASLVFVLHNAPSRLAFARLGDDSWNEFDIDCSCIRDVASCLGGGAGAGNTDCRWFGDVVFHKGQFYTSVSPGWIMALDLSSTIPRCTCLVLRPPPPPQICSQDVVSTSYLVESPDGTELMQVWRIVNRDKSSYLTNTFKVFKCKLNNDGGGGGGGQEEEAKWVEVKCLDEWVLFLGDNLSLALSANDFPELTPNSIYFTRSIYLAQREVAEFEFGVFHLESGTIEPLLFPNNKSWSGHMAWPVPVWIPHTECFPMATQIAKVEDITKRTKFNFHKKHRGVKVDGVLNTRVRYFFSIKHKPKKKEKVSSCRTRTIQQNFNYGRTKCSCKKQDYGCSEPAGTKHIWK